MYELVNINIIKYCHIVRRMRWEILFSMFCFFKQIIFAKFIAEQLQHQFGLHNNDHFYSQEIMKGAQIVYDIAHLRRPSMFDPNVNVEDPETSIGTPGTPAPSNFEIDDQFNLPISLALSLLVLYIFLGAVAFNWLEGWGFFPSFYFVFISMSTIGFGDYVPEHHTFMIFSIVYLVFGLALMSMCINVVQDKLSDTFKQASAKLGATLGVSVNDEDGSIATVPPEAIEIPEVHNIETNSAKVSLNVVPADSR